MLQTVNVPDLRYCLICQRFLDVRSMKEVSRNSSRTVYLDGETAHICLGKSLSRMRLVKQQLRASVVAC